jgi:hypothetical protein
MLFGGLKMVKDCEHNVYLIDFRQKSVPKRCLHNKIYAHCTIHDLLETNLYYHIPPSCQVPRIITRLSSRLLRHSHLSCAPATSLHVQYAIYSSLSWRAGLFQKHYSSPYTKNGKSQHGCSKEVQPDPS